MSARIVEPRDLDVVVAAGAVKLEAAYGQQAQARGIRLRPKYRPAAKARQFGTGSGRAGVARKKKAGVGGGVPRPVVLVVDGRTGHKRFEAAA